MPLSVTRVVLSSQYRSNCYLVRASHEASAGAVVDPGGDPALLLAEVDRLGASVAGILITHSDVDHIEGVAALVAATGAEVWAPAGEVDALRSGLTRGGTRVPPYEPEHEVRDGEIVSLAGLDFEVAGIPGHSVDHVAFCVDGSLFSGDLLFAGSVGRVDFPGGDWDALVASVRRLVERYGPDAIVYSGHGEPTTLGHELATNPFLGELRK
ncbi:MAG TPA: MBL fold metallo-hydrolase [Gaiellaceae bacterium]|nr:MBL fold metallo-hydrolase [Gaiellaceae bacterium]